MTAATELKADIVRNNHRVTIAQLDVEGQTGKVDIVRSGKDAWAGQFRVMVKLRGEREFRLLSLSDSMARENIRAIVEDRIHTQYVTNWAEGY